jgi:hypothetical protein
MPSGIGWAQGLADPEPAAGAVFAVEPNVAGLPTLPHGVLRPRYEGPGSQHAFSSG